MFILSIFCLFLFIYIYSFAAVREILTAEPESETVAVIPAPAPIARSTPTQTKTPSPTQTPTPTQIVYVNVLIDPGHGGDDYGAHIDALDLNEKIINMNIASRLYDLLKQDYDKINVTMTRHDETTISLRKRVEMANTTADFCISIHCNSNPVSQAHGISTYFKTHEEDEPFTSNDLAEVIQRSLVEATCAHDRGIQNNNKLYLLRHTTVPTVLVESGFLTNPNELQLLLDDSYIDLLAEGLRQGILEMADKVTSYKLQDKSMYKIQKISP